MVSFTPRPLYVQQRTPAPINKEAGWNPEPVLDVLLRGFEPRTVQPAANPYTDNATPLTASGIRKYVHLINIVSYAGSQGVTVLHEGSDGSLIIVVESHVYVETELLLPGNDDYCST
jgi:hypothetical protein